MAASMERSEPLPSRCPLCAAGGTALFHRDRRRQYRSCSTCCLVFVPPRYFLSFDAEKACYDQHQNNPDDPHYRRFLARLAEPMMGKLPPAARGLDFGSGPGPTLSLMFAEAGFPTVIYDPYYAPQPSVWTSDYDFVTATEVVEHLHRPRLELQRLWNVLKPGGWLGIMTKRVWNRPAFAAWHYKNDPTHVVFFSERTFVWLAQQWSAELEFVGADVVLLRKVGATRRLLNFLSPASSSGQGQCS